VAGEEGEGGGEGEEFVQVDSGEGVVGGPSGWCTAFGEKGRRVVGRKSGHALEEEHC